MYNIHEGAMLSQFETECEPMAKDEFIRNLYLTSDSELIVKEDRLAGVIESVKSDESGCADTFAVPKESLPDISLAESAG